MATILYAWEQGGGLGHLLRFLPLAQKLVARGHRVVAAIRELAHAEEVFDGSGVEYLLAPHCTWHFGDFIDPVHGYGHLLHNVGFGRSADLWILTRAWRTIFSLVRPNLIVCDHSPSALLAAAVDALPTVSLGTGFCCPPIGDLLPNLRPWLAEDLTEKLACEQRILANVNEIRAVAGMAPWQRLSELYASVRESFVTTFPELDHLPNRSNTCYWGVWEAQRGQPFHWPTGDGPRVFLYTHRFPARDRLVDNLRGSSFPTMVYTHELPQAVAERLAAPTLRISDVPLSVVQAAAECDIAILNAGHNTAAQFLLAGKPLLLIPNSLEQGLLTRRLVAQGLAIGIDANRPVIEIEAVLMSLVTQGSFRETAKRFSTKYLDYNAEAAQARIVEKIEEISKP